MGEMKPFKRDYRKFAVQIYPNVVSDFFYERVRERPIINKKTKLSSIGSCFAEHIARFLVGFDYPYRKDGRHIKNDVINEMMKFFEHVFVEGEKDES